MGGVVALFLMFSLSVSWFSGAKENDRLDGELIETQHINTKMKEQINQAQVKSVADAKQLTEINAELRKEKDARQKLEEDIERLKTKRAALVKAQIKKTKEKLETQYSTKITELEAKLKETEEKLKKLETDKKGILDKYEEPIKDKGVEVEKLPTIEEKTPIAEPMPATTESQENLLIKEAPVEEETEEGPQ